MRKRGLGVTRSFHRVTGDCYLSNSKRSPVSNGPGSRSYTVSVFVFGPNRPEKGELRFGRERGVQEGSSRTSLRLKVSQNVGDGLTTDKVHYGDFRRAEVPLDCGGVGVGRMGTGQTRVTSWDRTSTHLGYERRIGFGRIRWSHGKMFPVLEEVRCRQWTYYSRGPPWELGP